MVKASKESMDDVTRSLDFYRRIDFFDRDTAISKSGMRAAIALLQRNGDLKDALAVEKLIVPELSRLRE